MDNIHVVNSKNFSILEVTVVVIIMVFEEHDVIMGSPWIDDILGLAAADIA
jgi:hypothetical protein